MAPRAAASSSSVLFLVVLAAMAASASAATFTITNRCGYTVWPAGIPGIGGRQLNPGETWPVYVPAGTSSGRFWGRTGCSFNGGNSGHCDSGDCAGALACTVSGQPPATLAEFTLGGAQDFYDISLVDGFNQPMDFSCSTGVNLHCPGAGCTDAYLFPKDDNKTHACAGNSNYQITFCP